jgi:predicted nucleic acid-binding protein
LDRVVSNATPLIYLAKIGKLELLKRTFAEVIIPEQVRKEVVDKGKKLKHEDAFVIEKAINEGWLRVLKTDLLESPIELETGEIAVISLAKRMRIEEVLIDETLARTAAKLFGLRARGTIFVLLRALEDKIINLDEFLDLLQQLARKGFRLQEVIYLEAIRQARRIASSDQ